MLMQTTVMFHSKEGIQSFVSLMNFKNASLRVNELKPVLNTESYSNGFIGVPAVM